MAKDAKKQLRSKFRKTCWLRDKFCCVSCGKRFSPKNAETELDVHHILPRENMPGGGYVPENGISLCKKSGGCHERAEEYYRTGIAFPGYHPRELFEKIGSSEALAIEASQSLK
jgi:5-methylcytosine-specific restriction endonuclease McrA